MILKIDSTQKDKISIKIEKDSKIVYKKTTATKFSQAEKLLPLIHKSLEETRIDINKIRKIQVNNQGGTFTSLRIGVITANTLAYALGVPIQGTSIAKIEQVLSSSIKKFNIIKPIYNQKPKIT